MDSREASFDVDDFDPLNQNAKKIPVAPKRLPMVLPPILTTVPSAIPLNQGQAFSNPMYPQFIPSYMQKSRNSTPTNSIINSRIDDDVELLRKYGLDRFKLIDTKAKSVASNDIKANPFLTSSGNRHSSRSSDPFLDNGINGLQKNGSDLQPKTNNNWTTFDQ